MPRSAPDLTQRRQRIVRAALDLAEAEGWPAVTMRRVAGELQVTQPVIYSAFDGRQAMVDAVALEGFGDLAAALEAAEPSALARIRAYLDFAAARPRLYEAMFSLPSELAFATGGAPEPLRRAFAALDAVFPQADGVQAEVAWSLLHGLATLEASGRLRPGEQAARVALAHHLLTADE